MRPRRFVPALGAVSVALALLAPGRAAAHDRAPDADTEARGGEREGDAVEGAKRAYAAAAVAYDRRDYATAAKGFATADALAPNERALHLALASAFSAPDAALAMNLVERVEARARARDPARPVGATVQGLARSARRRFAQATGRVRVGCPAGASCVATLDGDPAPVDAPLWVAPGEHVVVLRVEGGAAPVAAERRVRVEAGSLVDVAIAATADGPLEARASVPPADDDGRPAPPEPARRDGLPPWVFWSGVGLSAGGVALSTALTVVLVGRHADFEAAPSPETSAAGDAAQARARVAWAATGGLVAATAVVGLFTDFRGSSGERAAPSSGATKGPVGARLALGAGGAAVSGWFP